MKDKVVPVSQRKPPQKKSVWYKSSAITTPLLVAFVLIALRTLVFVLNARKEEDETNILLVITIVQLAVLILPCILYYQAKGKRLESPMFMSMIRPSFVLFVIFALLMFVSGTVFIKYFYYISGRNTPDMAGLFDSIALKRSEVSTFGVSVAFVVVPAVCEELFFRGVVMAEYRCFGSVNAILMSAFCFAMFHFSIDNFFIYFFAGLVLGFVTAITRSLLAPIIIHLTSNALSIFGSDSFIIVTVQKCGEFFVGFVLLMIFLLALLFVIARLEQIYYSFAQKPPVSSLPKPSISNIQKVFLSPTFLLLVCIFLTITIIT